MKRAMATESSGRRDDSTLISNLSQAIGTANKILYEMHPKRREEARVMDTPPSPPSSSGKEQEEEEDEGRNVEYSVSDSPTPSSPEKDEDSSGDDEEYTPGKHKCDKCNKTFTGRDTLRRHRRTVHVPRRFKCNGCAMMFKTRSNLNRHQSKSREHCILLSKSSPLTRQEDSSKTSSSSTNNQVKAVPCNVPTPDNDSFASKDHTTPPLYNMLTTSAGAAKPLVVVKDENKSQTTLKQVSRNTENKSPATGHHYECERCEKVFQTPKILQAHVRKVHVLPRFRCSDCMRMFKCKNFLRKHRENPPKRCTLAAYRKRLLKKQEFNQTSPSSIDSQIKAIPYHPCPRCNVYFTSKAHLRRHLANQLTACLGTAKTLELLRKRNESQNGEQQATEDIASTSNVPLAQQQATEDIGYTSKDDDCKQQIQQLRGMVKTCLNEILGLRRRQGALERKLASLI
ncbi:uncharacterized protein [Apostichopus japonicus]|uniref:uncharacterized protein n=1 Tax=Stichopus japonicus TaxID=307972 RepID=UPI003AB91242